MKLTIIGAGGVRTPLLIRAIDARQDSLGIEELALMDIDMSRLMSIGSITHLLEGNESLHFKITRTDNLQQALSGSDYVITTFRVGGSESRVIDEKVPLSVGVLGQETTGAGGFAMGLRSIPVLMEITRYMEQVCPDAWLINFANPAGLMVQALRSATEWKRVVGICDAPSQFRTIFAALLKTHIDQIEVDYFGLNHLGWIRSIKFNGRNYLPKFIDLLLENGSISQFPFDPQLVSTLGLIPNEYLFYYYYSRQAVNNILMAGKTRGEQILEENQYLFSDIKALLVEKKFQEIEKVYNDYLQKRSGTYMQNETGARSIRDHSDLLALIEQVSGEGYAGVALDLIESLQGIRDRRLILNVPNQASIPSMDGEDIVEIPTLVSKNKIEPFHVGEIPDHCLGLMKTIKTFERLTIEAALEKSYKKASQALTIHPLIQDYRLAEKILDGYLSQHGDYFPRLV